jgi:hypothetical protein
MVNMPGVPDERAGVYNRAGLLQGVGGTSKQLTTMSELAVGWVRSLPGTMGGGNCIFWG